MIFDVILTIFLLIEIWKNMSNNPTNNFNTLFWKVWQHISVGWIASPSIKKVPPRCKMCSPVHLRWNKTGMRTKLRLPYPVISWTVWKTVENLDGFDLEMYSDDLPNFQKKRRFQLRLEFFPPFPGDFTKQVRSELDISGQFGRLFNEYGAFTLFS